MKKITAIITALLCLTSISSLSAQQTKEKYVIETEYLLYLPDGYESEANTQWPLVIFLHGGGETGDDIEKIKVHGLPKLIEEGMNFPFIGISPQTKTSGWEPKTVRGLVNEALAKYRVDPDRIYLTGMSMGGHGTWAASTAYPGLFAAIMPICGGGDPTKAYTLANTPVWNFHGDADDIVPKILSDRMVDAIREYNPSVKYTVYPGVGHDSWTQTYENPEVWEWLLSQRRYRHRGIDSPVDKISEYAGTYISTEEDSRNKSVTLQNEGDLLRFRNPNGSGFELHPAGGDKFFREPDSFEFVTFSRDGSGNVTGMTVYSVRRLENFIKKTE